VTFVVFVSKGADYFDTLNRLNLEIVERFSKAGIGFASPTRLLLDERGKV
jgi:small-conductance mechanosensitive channel